MMTEINHFKKFRRRLSRVAMKILDRSLDESIEDSPTSRLKIFGILVSLRTNQWFHDYEGFDYLSYYLIIRRGNRIVLNVRIDERLDSRKIRYIAEINKYIPRGWEWRILRAA